MQSEKYYELSNPQQRIWLTELMNNHVDMSNIGYLIQLKGTYDLERLAKAIKLVVRANDGLQLRFRYSDDEKSRLEQYIPQYEEIDVSVIRAADEAELSEKIETMHRQRFDITGNIFCSFAVFSINNSQFGFFQKANHLVADGISATIVAREALQIYQQITDNTFESFNKDISYMDFLQSEKEYIGSEKYNKSRDYWLKTFDDYEGEEITFADNKSRNSLKVQRCSLQVPHHLVSLLEEYKGEKRQSNFGLFMSALAIYFHRFMGHEDMVIGMPVHNRNSKVFKKMLGMFVSTIPLRITFGENWNFNDLMGDVKSRLWDSLKHQAYPYNHMVKDFKDNNIDSSDFLNVQLIELPPNLEEIEQRIFYSTQYNISQLSIYLNQQKGKTLEGLDIAIDFHQDIFDKREIEYLFKRLMIILEQAVRNPDTPIRELPLLDENENRRLLTELNDTGADYPRQETLPRLFNKQVRENPTDIALEYEDQTITYQQLGHLTDKLAVKLQNQGIKGDSIVGILCERSIEAIVSIMAVLKAGGAYLPIDPDYPLERKNYIIENSGINVLLVELLLQEREQELLQNIPGIHHIMIDYNALDAETMTTAYQEPDINSGNLAYVIYTSGTTGNPKGTLLRHRNVINYVWWGAKVYTKGEPTTFPLFTSLSFDLTVTSIFIPLITGNKMVIYRHSQEGLMIERVVKENKVDIIKLTPSHLKVVNQVISQSKGDTSRLKSFIVGGEELKTDTARETSRHFNGNINIYNEYGPTETAVGCMIHRYDENRDTGLAVPIGKPADNVQIYILDKNKKILPQGIIGEIYIAGEGVARGYHNREELTASKFSPLSGLTTDPVYRSGDLGRWNLDGILEFFGRCDEQVKVRGYRIEPGEIEKQLVKIEGIKDAVVLVRKREQAELCAYLVAEAETGLDVSQLRESLSRELPVYMIPSEFVQVEEIPLTRNHKVDTRKLVTLGTKLDSSQEYVAPRNEKETLLAGIWESVLGGKIGITDNFFELGGDSIKAVQIAARLNDAGKSINVKDILSHQTIANVCVNVDFESHIRKFEQGVIEGEKEKTPIEKWFLAQNFINPNHYNQSVLLKFKTDVNVSALEEALNKIVAHYDGLRLNYNKQTEKFYFNNVLLKYPITLQQVDLGTLSPEEQAESIETKGFEVKRGFDIYNGHMLKGVLFTHHADNPQLLLTLHHLVVDGYTWRVLLEALYNLYNEITTGKNVEMPQKTASLLDWYDALIMYRDSGKLDEEKSYWQEAEASDFVLPYDHEYSGVDWSVKNQVIETVQLEADKSAFLLKEAHEVYKTDVLVLVFAALVRTLRQWTHRQIVTVEMENHGRHIEDMDTSKTTGWFTAIFPLHVNREDHSIGDEIKTVKESVRKVPGNGIGYGILKYMTEAGETMETKRSQIRFNYLGQFDQEVENSLFSYSSQSTGADVDPSNHMSAAVEINAMIINNVFSADINYNREAFDQATMSEFGKNYISNLNEILEHIKGEDNVHFTPTDFDTVDLSEDDLDALFG